ncbi:hypothetical protein NDU88_001388 [Pleurodeles waltl]|uniref:Uncharacterized protein n=1 Tax=Pleurodeles waltl TaxID=8319 RepID=A0AAV7TI53_PLEWA|nr:hypothetical protein NDU88_001388 [Pleurodeles waltl]
MQLSPDMRNHISPVVGWAQGSAHARNPDTVTEPPVIPLPGAKQSSADKAQDWLATPKPELAHGAADAPQW